MKNKTIVLSLGGSLIAPDKLDTTFLKRFRKLIIDFVKNENRIIIVCGGGKTCRNYLSAASKISRITNVELDKLGIVSTQLNAELVRIIFGKYAYPRVIQDYNIKNLKFKVLLTCGYKPGHSSDFDSVMWAKNYNANFVANLTNIDYIYTSDPKKNNKAKIIKETTWNKMQRIVGTKWDPGANFPFDPKAIKYANKFKLKVAFLNGKKINNLKNFLEDKKFVGSIVY